MEIRPRASVVGRGIALAMCLSYQVFGSVSFPLFGVTSYRDIFSIPEWRDSEAYPPRPRRRQSFCQLSHACPDCARRATPYFCTFPCPVMGYGALPHVCPWPSPFRTRLARRWNLLAPPALLWRAYPNDGTVKPISPVRDAGNPFASYHMLARVVCAGQHFIFALSRS